MAKFELWQSSKNRQWYWHLKSDKTGKVICWAEGYVNKSDAIYSITWVRANATDDALREL